MSGTNIPGQTHKPPSSADSNSISSLTAEEMDLSSPDQPNPIEEEAIYNYYRQEVRKEIQIHKNKQWNQKLDELNFEDQSMWRMCNKLTKSTPPMAAILENNTWYSDPAEKENRFTA